MRILVDTSVWVQHFRVGVPDLAALLTANDVLTLSTVVGELAVGGLRNRNQTMADLQLLPRVPDVPFDDTLDFLERNQLFNIGLSWGDVEILAAAHEFNAPLWSFDMRVQQQAQILQLDWTP